MPQSIVLFDVDNLTIPALNALPQSQRDPVSLAQKTGKHLLDIAKCQGQIVSAYAAIALRRSFLPEALVQRCQALAIADTLVNIGYNVILVPMEPNIADRELCKIAYECMREASINAYVIGTGDGQEPFYSLFSDLERARLYVHVVVWDVVQHVVRFSEVFRVSRLCDTFKDHIDGNQEAQFSP